MPPKKKASKKAALQKSCSCGGDCHDQHAHLPGMLLVAFGLVALPISFGLIPGMEWFQILPLVLVLVGVVLIVKVGICRGRS